MDRVRDEQLCLHLKAIVALLSCAAVNPTPLLSLADRSDRLSLGIAYLQQLDGQAHLQQ